MKLLGVGLVLTVAAGGAAYLWTGSPTVAMTAVVFGLLATKLQYLAGMVQAKVAKDAPFKEFVKGWGTGMGLRLVGVVVLAVVCSVWPAQFPPVGAAIGYLGVVIPLLFLETRSSR
jgi:hypothetical protein